MKLNCLTSNEDLAEAKSHIVPNIAERGEEGGISDARGIRVTTKTRTTFLARVGERERERERWRVVGCLQRDTVTILKGCVSPN